MVPCFKSVVCSLSICLLGLCIEPASSSLPRHSGQPQAVLWPVFQDGLSLESWEGFSLAGALTPTGVLGRAIDVPGGLMSGLNAVAAHRLQ